MGGIRIHMAGMGAEPEKTLKWIGASERPPGDEADAYPTKVRLPYGWRRAPLVGSHPQMPPPMGY